MATTYEKIASVTVGSGGAASIDFTSIPGTFDDLVVKMSTRSNRAAEADDLTVRLNGVSSGYSGKVLQGSGSAAASFNNTSTALFDFSMITNGANSTASTFNNAEFYIPNYTGSTNKSVSFDSVQEHNATAGVQRLSAGLVTITSAITSISLDLQHGTLFLEHSTAVLYGIKKS